VARPKPHRIADILYTPGNGACLSTCTCGVTIDALTPEELAATWAFHSGARSSTREVAPRRVKPQPQRCGIDGCELLRVSRQSKYGPLLRCQLHRAS